MSNKYNLICDNGQSFIMELHPQPMVLEGEKPLEQPTIENEILKLENLFNAMETDKETSGTHPLGWTNPLPKKIISYEEIN
jgi:hypothetical protein